MDGAAAGRFVTERRMSTLSEVGTVFVEEVARGSGRLSYRVIGLAVPVILIVLLVVTPLVRGIFLDDEDDPESQAATGLGAVDLSGTLTGDYAGSLGIQVYPDRRAGLDALTAGEIEALFILPKNYLSVGRVEWLHTGSEGIFDDRADEAIVRRASACRAHIGKALARSREAVSGHTDNRVSHRSGGRDRTGE